MYRDDGRVAQKPGRVIVTYARSLISLIIARSLGERGIEVIGCDDVDLTVMQFSKYVKETFVHPPISDDPEGFLRVLEAKVQAYAPGDDRPYILMPVFQEIPLLAANRSRFEPTITLAAPDLESIDQVEPKDALARTAKRLDLDIPETRIVQSADEVANLAPDLPYPILIKPATGVGGRGIEILDDADALTAHVRSDPEHLTYPGLLQDLADGEDYCCAVLADRGQIKAIAAYRNLLTFPRKAGAGAVREAVDPGPFRETTARLMEATDWTGVAELDFRWNGKAVPKLIEVNPRFWAGLFQSVESGIDFPWALYRLAADGAIADQGEGEKGAITKSPVIWLLSAIEDLAGSENDLERLSQALDSRKSDIEWGAINEAFASLADDDAGDPLPLGDTWNRFVKQLSELSGKASETSRTDDPLVGLGILFVMSSLYRHGRLPPELTYKSEPDDRDFAPADRSAARWGAGSGIKPVIGVTWPERGNWLAFQAVRVALILAGAKTVSLTARAPRAPHFVDGLVFGGGADIFPERYGGVAKKGYRYDVARDDMEASWEDAARSLGLPVLGICRGAQMMNVLAGGTLHQDMSHLDDGFYPRSPFLQAVFRKMITIEERSLLHGLIGKTQTKVNSIHQQAINRLGDGLTVTARERNGTVQALEDPSRTFALGVQFHPEYLIYRKDIRALFRGFVDAARLYHRGKARQHL